MIDAILQKAINHIYHIYLVPPQKVAGHICFPLVTPWQSSENARNAVLGVEKYEKILALLQCKMSRFVEIFVPVPQEYMGIVIGARGRNINQLKRETDTRITSCTGVNFGEESGFTVTGIATGCEAARQAIRFCVKKWEDNEVCRKPVSPMASGSRTHSKVNDDVRTIDVPKEYIHFVVGKGRKNIEKIETKSGTKIIVPSRRISEAQDGDTVQVKIIGGPKNCDGAEARIRHCITVHKEKMLRNELGGDTHFVCFANQDENERFCLKPGGSAPKLDGFIQGQRYRIEIDDDDYKSEISDKTISEIKAHLLTPLQNLQKLKDEKQLMADLWCHFGKVLVSSVDEEETMNIMRPVDIDRRLVKLISKDTFKNRDKDAYWKVSFEEGVDQSDVNDDALPKFGDGNHEFFGLKLDHTQWRYDFAFVTPSGRSVRLKVWEGLPPGRDEPPVEVKNILRQVSLQAEEGIKAWICYPSTSCLRGEIMTPNSRYDCRIKLRAGYRYATDKDSVICMEEDTILSDYLSNCKLNKAHHSTDLPDPKDHEMPEGFKCTFYREAMERMFSATVGEESYTVIVLDEKGWDSDLSDKRNQKQFGIRVVMNSWSEALLSPERHWTPQEILDKLKDYMDFLSFFKDCFLDADG